MNNSMMNRFTLNPTSLDMKRSKFKRTFEHKTTFDAGKLIPFYCEEVLPGDTVSLDLASLIRLSTPIHPTMDNAWIDFQFYFVPNRLVWDHWVNFMGENTTSKWLPSTTYTIPQLKLSNDLVLSGKLGTGSIYGPDVGSVANYLGIPLACGTSSTTVGEYISVNALPFRGYAKIWNDWWRDENLQDPVNIDTGDTAYAQSNYGLSPEGGSYPYSTYAASAYVTRGFCGAAPLPVCKKHDYFTSCIISPQKGPDVILPLGSFAPIVNNSTVSELFPNVYNSLGNALTSDMNLVAGANSTQGGLQVQSYTDPGTPKANVGFKLAADLSSASAISVNLLRTSFQLQKFYEAFARQGSRYCEMIKGQFGVNPSDARLQRSEFLGGRCIPINMTQVPQTSNSAPDSSTTPQGNLAAYSQTKDNHSYFTKSFEEHGYLFGVLCVRTDRTYQQGINKMFLRKEYTDFYFPVFANIGEQPVKNIEIYAQTGSQANIKKNDEAFGFQEAWAEYRYSPNRVSGEFCSALTASLDSWHYADKYTSLPTLSAGWIREPQETIARTVAVPTEPQFIADIYVDSTWTRVMPLYSIPGLIDHH